MEHDEVVDIDASMESVSSKTFTFSRPNIIPSPSSAINFGSSLDQGYDSAKKNVFTFATPMAISEPDMEDKSIFESDMSEKQYKPKISRNSYKPTVNVFAHALKNTTLFEQLKKNARSQTTKINMENSITCLNVPKALLTKATAKEHFTAFGSITKIVIRPKKQIVTVVYATKEEADIAYAESGDYLGEKFQIVWTKSHVPTKSSPKKKHVSKFLASTEDDIKSELAAMMNLEYNLHGSNPDPLETVTVKKTRGPALKSAAKSTLRMERTAAKTEKLKSDSQISDLLPNASMEELQNIIRQAATTSEDKYKVLEARDRLVRLKTVKSHTLATAKVTSGTCPDMCPEKERQMREAKRQVALYEQQEGSEYRINHSIAVKQYSRSSADQEEPMAHELRPVKSLKMTMSYLLHEIANLCDQQGTNLGEWYHFLWDRTRGIRKDITQQELCCTDSVELVEQCARFHIVCSERLCAEESSVFDKKINSDNLTKCLQSLKYMYHDLREKGTTCKNEPEFRAYIILLNLNNGNFMWDLQRLPESVQKSPEVRFAMEVYFALESNNYYRFFKLVKRTTYLNACILLRYFNQVRLKALSVMVKAYCRTTSTAYPLYELIDILGFEDENEAIQLCEQVGLNASKDELNVLLNRQNFSMPVLNIKQNRACNMIEHKRITLQQSIGECIAGGKMPEKTYKYHRPHNSFDSQGYLLPESIDAMDQNNLSSEQIDPYEFVDEEIPKTQKSQSVFEKSTIKAESTNITEQANAFLPTITSESSTNEIVTPKNEANIPPISKPSTQSTTDDKHHVSTLIKTSTENVQSAKDSVFFAKPQDNVPALKKRTESSVFVNSFSSVPTISKPSNIFTKPFEAPQKDVASPFAPPMSKSIFSGSSQANIFGKSDSSTIFGSSQTNLRDSTESGISKSSADTKLKESPSFPVRNEVPQKQTQTVDRAKQMKEINEDAEHIFNDLQTEVIETCCSTVVKDCLDKIKMWDTVAKDTMTEILDEVLQDMCNNVLRTEIINEQKLHKISMRFKNKVIQKYFNIWKRHVHKERLQRQALDHTPVWLQRRSVEECAKSLYTKDQDLVVRNMSKRESLPEVTKSYINSLAPIQVLIYAGLKENLKSLNIDMSTNFYWKLVIAWPDLQNKPVIWHHKKIMNQYLCPENYTTEPIVKVYRTNDFETMHICIRHFEGFISDHNLIGTDALLFIAATSEDVKSLARRLIETVLSRDKLMPIPLVFIILGTESLESHNKGIVTFLEDLLESGYLSEYTIMFEKNLTEETILNLTQSSILWLLVNRSPPNPLEMDYLHDVFDTCLMEELWLRILGDSYFNKKLSHALKSPNFVINLHNEAVTHLMDIILDPETFMYTKFAPELKRFLKNQYSMPCSYEFFDDKWKEEEYKAKLESVMSTFILPQWKYPWPASNDQTLRQSIMLYSQEALSDSNSNAICSDMLTNVFLTTDSATISNFVDILLYIVKEKVHLLSEDYKVIYNKNHIKHFRTLPWWFKSNVLVEYKIPLEELNQNEHEKENDVNNEPLKKRRRTNKLTEDSFDSSEEQNELEPLAEFCENTKIRVMEVHHASKKIEERLQTQQQQTSLLEEKIRKALYNETDLLKDKA